MMQKNVAGQIWIVFAFDRTDNTPKTGDAAQITGNLRLDGAAADAIDDTNPAELEDGFYFFTITQAESNADNIVIAPASSTGDIQVIGVPGAMWTTAPSSNATVAQTADNDTILAELQSVLSAGILGRTNNPTLEGLLGVDDDAAEDTLVFQTWEEVLTGATHNVNNSSGRRLRQVESIFVLDTGTAQAGANGTITLDAGASAINEFYTHTMIVMTGGTGVGQVRAVESYAGDTKIATIVPDWVTNPASGATYEILADTTKHVAEVETGAIVAASFAAGAINAAATDDDFLAEVNAEVAAAMVTIHLDHLLAVNYDPASKPGVATALLNELIEDDGGVSRYSTNALEQGRGTDGVDTTTMRGTDGANTVVPDAAGVAPTAIENRAEMDTNSTGLAAIETDTGEIGTAGAGLTDLGGMSTGMKAEVRVEAVGALNTEIPKNAAFLNFPVDMVLTSDHTTAATGKTVTGEHYLDGASTGTAVTGTITEAEFGLYHFDAAQQDTNGDIGTWRFSATDCDDFKFSFTTVS